LQFIYNSDEDKNNDERIFEIKERRIVLKEFNFNEMHQLLKVD
jgi:hypothetical protein